MKKRYYQEDEYEDLYEQPQQTTYVEPDFGCGFCWDKKRQKNKDLYFLDAANNMRVCTYCPSCGRKFNEVQ